MENIVEIYPQEFKLLKIMSKNMKRKYIKKGDIYRLDEVHTIWKRTTIYTMINRLRDKGVLKEDNCMVSIIYSCDEIRRDKLKRFINEVYDGDVNNLKKDIQEASR